MYTTHVWMACIYTYQARHLLLHMNSYSQSQSAYMHKCILVWMTNCAPACVIYERRAGQKKWNMILMRRISIKVRCVGVYILYSKVSISLVTHKHKQTRVCTRIKVKSTHTHMRTHARTHIHRASSALITWMRWQRPRLNWLCLLQKVCFVCICTCYVCTTPWSIYATQTDRWKLMCVHVSIGYACFRRCATYAEVHLLRIH